METMRLRQRWMALPWGVYGAVLAVIFAAIGIYSIIQFPDEKPSARVVMPMFALSLYWVMALLCNRRSAVITPEEARVSIWPLLVSLPRRIKRDKIHFCYVRMVEIYDEGTVLESYSTAGVETTGGFQIDISTSHQTTQDAMQIASRAAHVLNQSPSRIPLEVRKIPQLAGKTQIFWILAHSGFWLLLFIGSILLGFFWEEERGRVLPAAEAVKGPSRPPPHASYLPTSPANRHRSR